MADGMAPLRVIENRANDTARAPRRSARRGTARQTTLKNAIHCSGVGVHGGQKAVMTLRPAAADSGIAFRRTDVPGAPTVPAHFSHAVESPLCSKLVDPRTGASVSTIEHLMAALAGCGVDNVLVEIDGPEVPIMDGSAAPFVFLIECAGIETLDASRRAIEVLRPIEVREPHRTARLLPHDGFAVDFAIDFDSAAVGAQRVCVEVTPTAFKQEIARARTFGFLHEVDQLRQMGLARGGSLDNAIVIDGDTVLNEGGLRYADEFVRHKALDSIGDLLMAGKPLLARFEGDRAGHALTLRLLQALFADPANWAEVELRDGSAASADLPLAAGA
jgi:UDP-3-O-[3-hydroxymyristoyl] N-acetylglucosamine deacetylase